MSYIKHTSKIALKGCRHSLDFQKKVEELIASMEKGDESIKAKVSIKVSRNGDSVKTKVKESEGLSDESVKIFNDLEEMAHDICKKGGDPSKVKGEIEVEKEI